MMRPRTFLAITAGSLSLMLAAPAQGATGFSTATRSAADPRPTSTTQVWQLRTGNDGRFDRIVLDERFSGSGYTVKYVRQLLTDPRGSRVAIRGRYFLQITVPDASTAARRGAPTRIVSTYTPGLPEIAQIKKIGEFERVVTFGVGLNRLRGFRVLRLSSPTRLVIDVLH